MSDQVSIEEGGDKHLQASNYKQVIQAAYRQFLNSRQLKPRTGQKQMIAAITNTLANIHFDAEGVRDSTGHVCVVEAGTGTGKTVAYFLAALPLAKVLGKKLVVSTATVALQEQIVYKDLPDIRQSSGMDFSFALVKGRGRYLCLAKLDRILNDVQAQSPSQMSFVTEDGAQTDEQSIKLYQSMMEALSANQWDGDKDNWPAELPESQWRPLTSNHRQCAGRRCSYVGSCSFFRSRDRMDQVDCVVTNHDMVLSDLALGGGAILPAPEQTLYVFDEGHHLADKARNHFSYHGRLEATLRWLDECQQNLARAVSDIGTVGDIQRQLERLPGTIDDIKRHNALVQGHLTILLEQADDGCYRFARGEVAGDLRELAADFTHQFQRVADSLLRVSEDLSHAMEDSAGEVPKIDIETWYPIFGAWLARAESVVALWQAYAQADVAGELPQARWLQKIDNDGGSDIEVCVSPILATNVLDHLLWNRCAGAVVTSATLTALGQFERLKLHSGIPNDSFFVIVPSPFDYSKVTLQIPANADDGGNAENHSNALVAAIPELLNPREGSLVLFASRRQMHFVFDALPLEWQCRVLMQDQRSKQEVLVEHKRRIDDGLGSIIFGLASFAEGVDLPGDYCRHVLIAKIPFAVPDNPVEAALAEWVESGGGNAFMELSVPDAALKLVQACGRLIRTEEDSGVVTIMDRRLLTKRYGKAILSSLPPFKREFSY